MSVRFINLGLTKYPIALIDMEIAKENVLAGSSECVFITEHEPLYSAGKSFESTDFLVVPRYPVYFPKRGGRVTVHAPGQLVIYPIINLKKRNLNVHSYIEILESWIIQSLGNIGVNAELSDDGVGVWASGSKIGFIGVRIEHGVTSHGLCLNVSNDLSMFRAIIPCGINGVTITSLKQLGTRCNMSDVVSSFIQTSPF